MDQPTSVPTPRLTNEAAASRGTATKARPLRQWLWTSYLKTTLYPLLLVEVVIVAIYVWTTATAHRENTEALRQISTAELSGIARREARSISERLSGVSRMTAVLARQTAKFLAAPPAPTPAMREELTMTGTLLHTRRDIGLGAVYYSDITPLGDEQRDRAAAAVGLSPLLRDIKDSDDLVIQAYLNTHDSMNVLYPYADLTAHWPSGLDVR